MARLARVVIPGVAHHVTQRGVRSMDIFLNDSDRALYLSLLNEQATKRNARFLGYCLMDNHVHFLIIPEEEDDLRAIFGEAHRRYTRNINFRQKTRGYLFQGRFFSCPLEDRHLLAAARYVERNPVRAGISETAKEYYWSSARFNLDMVAEDILIPKKHPLFGKAKEWEKWLSSDPKNVNELRKNFRTGRPLGSYQFLRQAERITGRSLIPRKPGPEKQS
ncbi:transposase [bacterium]|nr:transposase [bacterium]